MKNYLILGAGAAGTAAAQAIRTADPQGSIVMVSQETELPYNRPMLTKSLNQPDLDAGRILIHPAQWYQEQQIDLRLGVQAARIDPAARQVLLADKTALPYDRLIYAMGASCFVPPIPGAQDPRVKTIRTTEDVRQIQQMLKDGSRAVLIGGGVLGLEAAWGLCQAGKDVTVLEAAPRLMPRQLDEPASELIRQIAANQGIHLFTGVNITEIKDNHDSLQVVTQTGSYPGDLVLVSAGVRANTALAKEAGIATERAVIINERAETNLPDLYACGDCAQFHGINYALWSQALAEGAVAGANAAGGSQTYAGVTGSLTFFGLGTMLFACGDNGSSKDAAYETLDGQTAGANQYRRAYFRDGRLCGVILIGSLKGMKELNAALAEKASLAEVKDIL